MAQKSVFQKVWKILLLNGGGRENLKPCNLLGSKNVFLLSFEIPGMKKFQRKNRLCTPFKIAKRWLGKINSKFSF